MNFQPTPRQLSAIKTLLLLLTFLPALRYAYGLWSDSLGANPIEALTRGMGIWTLNFLLITLCVSPLRKLSGWHWLLRLRRMLGLTAFAYGSLHLLTYAWLDQFWDVDAIARDVWKRPFITLGFTAFLLMLPLALTSSNAAIRRLGGKRWQGLHRAVYVVAILGVVHYLWLVKRVALLDPIIYAILLAVLLGWRMLERMRRYGPWPARPTPPAVQPVVFMKRDKVPSLAGHKKG
ncbi:MAG TPA: protein-methionine-sulfoxide reductase heme-binding subunit MsrQ [Azospira sp.]|nr:protein-methionine-sulfoxide reductase heme-binding subunit MsrQ [Azospira sp.]